MYFTGSVVGKASIIEILHTPPLIFTRGQKVPNLESFKISLNFEPPAFENAAKLKQMTCAGVIALCFCQFGEVGSTHLGEPLGKSASFPKIARRKRAESSITQP